MLSIRPGAIFDHPPMVAWLISFGTMLFGDTEFGIRVGATMSWLVTAYFMHRFTSDLFGRMSAFLALLLLSVLPSSSRLGQLTTPDAPLTAAWSAALYFLHRAIVADRPKAWLGAGVSIGLGMLSKYTIALLGPAALVFLIVDPRSRRWLSTKWPYICAGVVATLFSPVIAWNANHDSGPRSSFKGPSDGHPTRSTFRPQPSSCSSQCCSVLSVSSSPVLRRTGSFGSLTGSICAGRTPSSPSLRWCSLPSLSSLVCSIWSK